jgi:hypothetical protein
MEPECEVVVSMAHCSNNAEIGAEPLIAPALRIVAFASGLVEAAISTWVTEKTTPNWPCASAGR